MRSDFENDADVLIRKTRARSAHGRVHLAVENRHLLANEQFAHFIVFDVDLGRRKDGRLGGLPQELDQEIEVEGAVEHA